MMMMKSIARLLTLVVFFCAWSTTTTSALYFPQSDLSIRVPSLGKNQLGSGIVLLSARTLNNDSSVPTEATYQILPLKDKSAALVNGSVVLLDAPRRGSTETIVVQATGKAGAEAFLEIKVLPQYAKNGKINCTDYVQDICFWNSSRYRIYENQPTTMLGTLGPSFYQTLCPQFFKPEYDLLNGTEFFHLSNDRLWANASLDRDSWDKPRGTGPRAACEVRCVVWDETTGIQYTREKVLHVDVLDENDNPPVSQTNTSVHIYLKDFLQGDRLDEQDLIFKDADDVSTNSYDIRLLEDHHNALNLVWNTMSVDHPKMPPSTAIFARLYSKTTLLPKSPYHVILQVSDVSLLPGYGNNTINITLSLMGPQHYTSTTAPSNHPDGLSALTASKKPGATAAIVYTQETILVSRYSGQYYRITQPLLLAQREAAAVQFSLRGPKAFNVTSKGGIVYVADPQALAAISNAINLRIEWKAANEAKPTSYAILSLKIVDLTDACKQNPANGRSCANAKTAQECQGRCGIAAGGNFSGNSTSQVNGTTTTTSGCAWRSNGNGQASSTMTEKYETCSANLKYCPDNVCDELEYLDLRICPQDCAIETELRFAEVNKAGRGIKRGFGTCWCEDFLICTCGSSFRDMPMSGENSLARSAKKDQQQQGRDKPTAVDVQQAAGSMCGTSCLIGVSVACSFAFVSFMAIVCFWRTRIASKVSRRNGGGCMRRGSSDTDAHGLGILPQDYVERGAAAAAADSSGVGVGNGLLIGLDSMTAINRSLMPPKSLTTDPKWEFPRARLQIEQVLGEGEFGRVLRAKAHDIAGQPGVQTVAVKTLKECANSGELADLLSEYELLKDVKHPNVIRLLGACTGASGPVYLIIEFAEYGSLRNYLRKSRHLDTDGRLPSAMSQQLLSSSSNNGLMGTTTTIMDETSLTSSNESITPRDIISFAWQISKGMAYLADVKLVHRDLAARNVLLAAGRQCKISDFGLTRDIYEDDAYLKRSKGRVPVKWMAPESLADHVYTSKSDVWSFGILLWELITLGASPYPGVDVHNLYNLLKSGYRMDRPANCSTQLYKLMTSCWHDEPGLRPSFKELALVWEGMLEAAADYLQLAQPRMVHNQAYFTSLNPLDSPRSTASSSGEYEQPRKIPRSVAAASAASTVSSRSSNNSDSIKRDESDKDTAVNYLNKSLAGQHRSKQQQQQQLTSKCDKVDKLEDLWQVDHRLRQPSRSNYVNESAQEAYQRHYESPIRLRNRSVASNSENESTTTPTGPSPDDDEDIQAGGGRPQSYIDMQSGTAGASSTTTTTAADNGGAKMKLAEAESLLMSFGGGSEIGV
ncbi:proto-oncogene tyrosine-protein kinase receptor Ret isoform X1 [Trichogramma pretiosum]|uniref:proto-oncogene tyrosine-protein kinase receptor Ret isoform X1 n=1 Tax=Trichogramma pretiosum TaxID=7493 RepID=UPI0006C9C967|nr:proto-oncogene tyrosine-protein kinase receptor Ret isoform X1 [Trichogramma pretiosum]XP_023316144.1 proto-oncogene tyrosine-protein kinase receptor Ret isoform X1 [Trichogramma pretiosum]